MLDWRYKQVRYERRAPTTTLGPRRLSLRPRPTDHNDGMTVSVRADSDARRYLGLTAKGGVLPLTVCRCRPAEGEPARGLDFVADTAQRRTEQRWCHRPRR
jgi:hypothetical protein